MAYVDGFVVAVAKDKLEEYKKFAEMCGKVWKEHGALSYVENVSEDVPYGNLTSFPRAVMANPDETVVLSWITYASRQDRDTVNAKVMADSRMQGAMEKMPVDGKRIIIGGFETLVQL